MKTLNLFKGDRFTIKAVASEGYTFSHWTSADGSRINDASSTITASKNESYTAHFTKNAVAPPPEPEVEWVLPEHMKKVGFWYGKTLQDGESTYVFQNTNPGRDFAKKFKKVVFNITERYEDPMEADYSRTGSVSVDISEDGGVLNFGNGSDGFIIRNEEFITMQYHYRDQEGWLQLREGIHD